MKTLFLIPCVALLLVPQLTAAQPATSLDVRRGVPNDVFLLVYSKHNPERDFQRQYYEDIWKTVEETKIIERAIAIVTSRLEEEDVEAAKSVIQELQEAAKPIDMESLSQCKESVYAQRMQIPTAQHLALVRLTPEAAASTAQGVKNLFGVAKKYLQEAATIEESSVGDAEVTTLSFGGNVPFQPTVARVGDILMLTSSSDLARQSLEMLTGAKGKSKFDDERLVGALKQLPEAEDGLVFFDGRTEFKSLRAFGPFMRQMSGNDPNVERAIEFMNLALDEVGIFDYEVTVNYTEGNLNRSASYGKLLPNTQQTTLAKMLGSGKPFDKWYTWVPAGALSYSLGTGVNCHPAYEKLMSVLREKVPESKEALEQFEQLQAQFDIHLDRDILQAFSGEYISITLPSPTPSMAGTPQSFLALRCRKPDRIKELIHRGMEALQENPALKAQQIKLTESAELDGFEQLAAPMLTAFGIQPVIGFQEGWMMIGSSAQAVQQVLDTKAGKGDTIEKTEAFSKLDLKVVGPVASIKYANSAEGTRNFANMLRKAGLMAPMIMAMAGAQAGDADLKPIQEVLALLPDVAKIVEKFDFLEAKISVAQDGGQPGSYTKKSVVVVRAPGEK